MGETQVGQRPNSALTPAAVIVVKLVMTFYDDKREAIYCREILRRPSTYTIALFMFSLGRSNVILLYGTHQPLPVR
jgi:hypothetical protein